MLPRHVFRTVAAIAWAAALATAHAQGQPRQLQRDASSDSRANQKVERIRIEDESSRIDELRVGGQTQSITVQPKGSALPAYEIQPGDLARSRPQDKRDGTGNARVWNVLNF
jgi:hypothetical protein